MIQHFWIPQLAGKTDVIAGATSRTWINPRTPGTYLVGTATEWSRLITRDGLTIGTNLFGTTFYALVRLHASHVVWGLVMLSLISVLAGRRPLRPTDAERVELVSWYSHFVDGVWVVVLTVVDGIGR